MLQLSDGELNERLAASRDSLIQMVETLNPVDLAPMLELFVMPRSGGVPVIRVEGPLTIDERRYTRFANIGARVAQDGDRLLTVTGIMEAWSRRSDVEDAPGMTPEQLKAAAIAEYERRGPVRDDPARFEIIGVQCLTCDGRIAVLSYRTARTPEGYIRLGEPEGEWWFGDPLANLNESRLLQCVFDGYNMALQNQVQRVAMPAYAGLLSILFHSPIGRRS